MVLGDDLLVGLERDRARDTARASRSPAVSTCGRSQGIARATLGWHPASIHRADPGCSAATAQEKLDMSDIASTAPPFFGVDPSRSRIQVKVFNAQTTAASGIGINNSSVEVLSRRP